jgi:hypothetical protein
VESHAGVRIPKQYPLYYRILMSLRLRFFVEKAALFP